MLAPEGRVAYTVTMTDQAPSSTDVLAVLRAHQDELSAAGIETMAIFGSVARGEATARSDVDVAIRAGAGFSAGGFDHFAQLEALRRRLVVLLGREVDLVEESAVRPGLRDVIAREGMRAF